MDKNKMPSAWLSAIPLVSLLTLLFIIIRIFGSDALNGASQIALLLSAAICIAVSVFFCKGKWEDFENRIASNIKDIATAIIILLLIGALAGSWMISGVVPTMIYYGMKILNPDFFLASGCLICAVVSVMTGSSWSTIATVGIALMGIGEALGFSSGWTAGAIISGAYFGDKVSPLSDTTVLASSVSGTPLFKHIRYLMITTIPSMLIALAIYTVAGFSGGSGDSPDRIAEFSSAIDGTFNISLLLLLIPVFTGILIARKVPSVVTLFLSALAAGLTATISQPHILHEISSGTGNLFADTVEGLMKTWYGNTSVATGYEPLDSLVATKGMGGMMNTIWLIICAMCFGGAMTASGMLKSLISLFLKFMKNRTGLVSSTVFSGLTLNICTADQYISIILLGNMFKDIYREKGYESRLLSRTTEDSVTVTSVLIPWNTCGLAQSTVLGTATIAYLPYCFFNLISPLMSIIVAATGYRIFRHAAEPGKNEKRK